MEETPCFVLRVVWKDGNGEQVLLRGVGRFRDLDPRIKLLGQGYLEIGTC